MSAEPKPIPEPDNGLAQLLRTITELIKSSHNHIMQGMGVLQKENQDFREEWRAFRAEILNDVYVANQTAALANRRVPVSAARKIRCVFIVHDAGLWDALSGIYDAMRQSATFDPVVVTIPYEEEYWKRRFIKTENAAHEGLTARGVAHLRLNMPDSYIGLDIMKALVPDIVFRQTPVDGGYPPAYQTAKLSFARLCYVPCGDFAQATESAGGNGETDTGLIYADKYFHQMCWKIFCESDVHRTMYARTSTRGGDNLTVAGCPRFDELLQTAREKPPIWPVKSADGKKRFRIIWAPHSSVAQKAFGFGVFPDVYKDMLAWARESGGIEFVLWPHPSLFDTLLEQKLLAPDEINAFLATWDALPNTARYDCSTDGAFFAASDTLLTDSPRHCTEYQLLKKPIIYIDSQRHTGLNAAGELVMQSANRVTNVVEARALCDRLQKGEPDPMRDIQAKSLPRIMPNPGKSAQKILDAIREGLAAERGES